MTTAQHSCKVVSLTHRPPLPQEILLVLISVRSWVETRVIVRRSEWTIQMTPAGIEPATFLFVAQHLSHCATAVPKVTIYSEREYWFSRSRRPLVYMTQAKTDLIFTVSVYCNYESQVLCLVHMCNIFVYQRTKLTISPQRNPYWCSLL